MWLWGGDANLNAVPVPRNAKDLRNVAACCGGSMPHANDGTGPANRNEACLDDFLANGRVQNTGPLLTDLPLKVLYNVATTQ